MQNASVEQAVRQQMRDEIGDDETLNVKAKNMLLQKFGLQPAYFTAEELGYWQNEEPENV
jgi:hypothetical protein